MKISMFVLLVFLFFDVQSQNAKFFNLSRKKVAISGYDPVSYFNRVPLKGKSQNSYKFNGVLYYFANEDNKSKFIQAPEKYIPQYGGWCAYALGNKGELMDVDPKTYKITDNKLFLFYNSFFTNALEDWNENEDQLIQKANRNWKKIVSE